MGKKYIGSPVQQLIQIPFASISETFQEQSDLKMNSKLVFFSSGHLGFYLRFLWRQIIKNQTDDILHRNQLLNS